MARAPYSTPLFSWQGLGDGDGIYCRASGPPGTYTVVLRTVTYYFGGPSAVLSNSAVVYLIDADSGNPTVDAYDSGITGHDEPLYIAHQPNLVLKPFTIVDDPVDILAIVNTSDADVTVDVAGSGFVLTGDAPVAFEGTT